MANLQQCNRLTSAWANSANAASRNPKQTKYRRHSLLRPKCPNKPLVRDHFSPLPPPGRLIAKESDSVATRRANNKNNMSRQKRLLPPAVARPNGIFALITPDFELGACEAREDDKGP